MANKKKKILVVDDSQSVRQQIAAALEHTGVEVLEADNGQSAIEIIQSDSRISLVFADVNMPYVNGIEMVKKLEKEIKRGLPIVMLTTESEPSLIKKAKISGAKGWMVKPFKPQQIESVVEKLAR